MKQIRKSVFETNSSSVHALCFDTSGREPSQFKLNKDGNIEIDFGSFGRECEIYNTQYEKLSYLITAAYYVAGMPYDLDDVYENWEFGQIRDAVCDYTGANDIVILNNEDPYIDHQSVPSGSIELINTWMEDEVIDFVFNKYVALKTYSD